MRDVAEAQLRIAESSTVKNRDRYNLVCHSDEGFLSLSEVQAVLQEAYPGKGIGGGVRFNRKTRGFDEIVREGGPPPAVLEKCITQLGMTPIPPAQTLIDNAESQIALGLVNFRDGVDNYQKDQVKLDDGSTSGSLDIVCKCTRNPADLRVMSILTGRLRSQPRGSPRVTQRCASAFFLIFPLASRWVCNAIRHIGRV